jgi:hypothetical protein
MLCSNLRIFIAYEQGHQYFILYLSSLIKHFYRILIFHIHLDRNAELFELYVALIMDNYIFIG